ncbi:uncharacterized protein G2W53_035101 [Senna tora]|uniref:Retrotransposon gag domain-containing protein n=1 Tax=Senna tora TaxID=362788 RepID=A0A834SPI5_9FABA|nr:uncharacterized protein G2W53_035101 [Senna tora]
MPCGKKKKKVIEISPPPVRGRKMRGRAISHSPVRSLTTPFSPKSIHSEEAEMAEQNNRNVSDYATPKLDGLQHSIRRPSIQANNFEIKPATIQLLQANGQFGGSPVEDPNNHILNFLEICDTFKHNGVSDDAIRLRLFPFSLRNKAKFWLQSLPEGSITTWEVSMKLGKDSKSLRKCPHHGLPKWLQVQTFYNGLSSEIITSIDVAAGGALMSKPVDAAYTLLETMSSNNHQWHSDRHVHGRVAGVQDSDMFASLSSQIVVLTKKVKSLGIQGAVKIVSPFVQACENCGEIHTSEQWPLVLESVQYLANRNANNPYSNTYNLGWRNHPNFSWSQNQGAGQSSSSARPNNPPGFNIGGFNQQARALPPPAEKKPSLEEMMMSYMSKNDALMQNFVVLDYEEDREVPIILGRPFLTTGRTIIDVQKGELKMRVQEEEVTFNVFKAMKLPGEPEECFRVNVIESSIDSTVREIMIKSHLVDPLEATIMSIHEHDEEDICDYVKMLESSEMPPKRKNPSSSFSSNWDTTRFVSETAEKCYKKKFFVATPKQRGVSSIVREFYSNYADRKDGKNGENPDYKEIAKELGCADAKAWTISSTSHKPKSIKLSKLHVSSVYWLHFIGHHIIPAGHFTNVDRAAKKNIPTLFFPCLITALCAKERVPWLDSELLMDLMGPICSANICEAQRKKLGTSCTELPSQAPSSSVLLPTGPSSSSAPPSSSDGLLAQLIQEQTKLIQE